MEYMAFMMGITSSASNEFGKLHITPRKTCLCIRADVCEEKEFYKHLRMLKGAVTLYAYKTENQELLEACRNPYLYGSGSMPEDQEGTGCLFDEWTELSWILDSEDAVSAYWLSEALNEASKSKRYLALYYAWKGMASSIQFPESEQYQKLADLIRQDKEILEEQGICPEEVVYEEELFDKLFTLCYHTIKNRK